MAIPVGGVNHFALTVTDTARSKEFYMTVLGFQYLMDLGPKVLLGVEGLVLALNLPPDASQAIDDDQFSEHRVGLDHISLSVGSREDLEAAVKVFDEHGVPHGEINDLGGAGLPMYVLAFRDPDNIQLELTAPHA